VAVAAGFRDRLSSRVRRDRRRLVPGVGDEWGMARPLPLRRRVANAVQHAGLRLPPADDARLARLEALADGLEGTEALLVDPASRELLMTVLSLRVLGPRRVELPVSQPAFRAACARIERELRREEAAEATGDGAPLDRYEIDARGGPVTLIGLAYLVHEFFGEELYALRRHGTRVAAEPGDVVIDAGGGWGETALYFADAVGAEGRVLALEFVPDNLRLLHRNLELNPRLAGRIEVIPHPIWSAPGVELAYEAEGGTSSVTRPGSEVAVTESVDHLCAQRGIERVDFLKLDVEGAEMQALAGAEDTIRRHRPKLALSVYHRDEDLVEIPAWVDGLGLGYRQWLDHRWPGQAETVLFAQPA
jgi:FkbM family methyltransferase